MNIRYPIYEGVYRILTKIVLFQSCFLAFIFSWNIEILQSHFLEIMLSIILS